MVAGLGVPIFRVFTVIIFAVMNHQVLIFTPKSSLKHHSVIAVSYRRNSLEQF